MRPGWKNRTWPLVTVIVVAAAWALSVWMANKCQSGALGSLGAGCLEYWLNRYQTLLAGLTAIAAAFITIRAAQHHLETVRADAADQRLASYAVALGDVLQKHEQVRRPGQDETMQQAEERLQALKNVTESPTIRAAMIDNLLGRDQGMMALFVNCCRQSAETHLYNIPDRPCRLMVWPLYLKLSESINERRARLRNGVPVSSLYTLSMVDHAEFQRAFVEQRAPRI